MAFPGVRKAVEAFTLGGATEQDAYNAEERRLITAKSQGALMDRRVREANMSARKDDARGSLADMLDMSKPENAAIIAELASQFSSAQTGVGTRQENVIQKQAIDAFNSPEGLSPEVSNAIHGIAGRGSFITGSHVDPTGDSTLKQENITALTNAANSRAAASDRSGSPYGNTKLTDGQAFAIFGRGDDPVIGGLGDWMQWQSQKRAANPDSDPRLLDLSVGSYIAEKKAGAGQAAISGAVTSGSGSSVMDGKTSATAIESSTLTEAPVAGTWLIVDGKRQQYLGQKAQ